MDKPRWLNDEPEIAALLNHFLDKFDRKPAEHWKQAPEVKLTEKTFPSLFKFDDNAIRQWDLFQSLEPDVFQIKTHKKRPLFEPEFNNARLIFNWQAEHILRLWFDRPSGTPPLQQWTTLVTKYADAFPGSCELLLSRRFTVAGLTPEEVVAGLVAIGGYLEQTLTLRQLSALCFKGYSKVLDGKEPLVQSLYPKINIKLRPLLMSVYLPSTIDSVLFIENQDSYNTILTMHPELTKNQALVYCSGFKGSAQRIREPLGVSIAYQGDITVSAQFEAWWFTAEPADWPCYFWGDLDYAGMAILKALRQRFRKIEAWQYGYGVMLGLLEQGQGYRSVQSKKHQTDPLETGCHYADTLLLPSLRQHKRFIDQEIVI